MQEFVLDASVAFAWCFPGDPTEFTAYNKMVLMRMEFWDAVVPEIWPFEIANTIYVSFSRRKRITEIQIQEFLDSLKDLPIRVERQDLWTNVALESMARKHNLAAYDAAYLELALRQSIPLATSDEGLKKAALACGVKLF